MLNLLLPIFITLTNTSSIEKENNLIYYNGILRIPLTEIITYSSPNCATNNNRNSCRSPQNEPKTA